MQATSVDQGRGAGGRGGARFRGEAGCAARGSNCAPSRILPAKLDELEDRLGNGLRVILLGHLGRVECRRVRYGAQQTPKRCVERGECCAAPPAALTWPSLASTLLASFMHVRLDSSHSNTLWQRERGSEAKLDVSEPAV